MSVVIVTPDRYETIRKTIRYLHAQTVRDRLEIIIVAPAADRLVLNEAELVGFSRFCVIPMGEIRSNAQACAAGIRQASAPVVALAEDHAYPAPGWAEALIAAHRQLWAVVAPAVGNANPGSLVSWAALYVAYGLRVAPAVAGETDELPGYFGSYKRAVLLEYGAALEQMLESDTLLHWDLRAKGYRLYLEATARTDHINISRLFPWLGEQFHSGQKFAALRARRWSLPRRFLHAICTPLKPLLHSFAVVRDIRRSGRQPELLPWLLPLVLLGFAAAALGEMIGYACSARYTVGRLYNFQFLHERHLTPRDRHALAER
jgi:glycosyltransferase involved in cell wall biosynthesis